jgi:hypothetical protein
MRRRARATGEWDRGGALRYRARRSNEVVAMSSNVLKAVKSTIQDYASMEPGELVSRLRDPELIKRMKKFGVNDAQIHRTILILKEHKPNSKEFTAYLNSKLV